jgi:hypothetical protein
MPPTLPNEIWDDILHLLPFWDIWRLRNVSKTWYWHIQCRAVKMALLTQLELQLNGHDEAHQFCWEGLSKSIKTTVQPEDGKIYFWLSVDGWSEWFENDQRASHEMIAADTHECFGSQMGHCHLKLMQPFDHTIYRLPFRLSLVNNDTTIYEFPRESDCQTYPTFELHVHNKSPYPVDEDLGLSVWGAFVVPLFQFVEKICRPRREIRSRFEVHRVVSGKWISIGEEWEGVDITAAAPCRYPCHIQQIGRRGTKD